ncbi:rod shape-determining protein MreD [Nocardioides dokdonensis FR1436]|uniref:Rod shape-determining protein MreD n=1 Tax=Nocardioides dokdonensis FR1436 TaxID=1300347 RepID=A0A1A9GMY2_9ACTN|nr:rod shape-determining protein MreD [Nocardioides dokdonensis]ANH38815.1 rod shape-determining protein MreD [Nocardioides dokdonensis FR1436]
MTAVRAVVAAVAVVAALVLQVSVFGPLAWEGIVPNLCLLVVVAGALTRGPQFAMVLGFGAGLLLDLAPPADHVAGRWALALLLVGYLVGRVRPESRPTATTVVATVAAASFVGTSVFALTGIALQDPVVGVGQTLQVLVVSLVWDVLLTPFVLPPLMALFRRLEPAHAL